MKTKVKFILIMFFVAPLLYMCTQNSDDCNCSPFEGSYFDIEGIDLINYKRRAESSVAPIEEGETVLFNDYRGLLLSFDVSYLSNHSCQSNPFIASAYACSCVSSGNLGSKTEMFESIDVTTINDFDETHLANQSINDLIMLESTPNESPIYLSEFLGNEEMNIQFSSYLLLVDRKPTLNSNFKVRITVELSNGEIYEQVSNSFVLQ